MIDLLLPDSERARARLNLTLSTFGLLALELALIRWMGGQVRIFAYFSNLVLIGAFLGMGLGLALSRSRPDLRRWTLPALLGFTALVVVGGPLGLLDIGFPDATVHLWGAEVPGDVLSFLGSLAALFGLFACIVGIFVLAGVHVGVWFRRLETLEAYSFDLLGSLLGILAITLVTAQGAPPPVWFAVGALPFLLLSPGARSALALAGVVAATWVSAEGALYSAYNRIEVAPRSGSDFVLWVNRDFHQYMTDLSTERIRAVDDPEERRSLRGMRTIYDLPYTVDGPRERALILGAGAGNDARAALRTGFDSVYAVEIDGRILRAGRALHPEAPYADDRVRTINDDARAFLERYRGPPFDVVSFGFLDSHAMFSAMSSLRLENYVYTEEGLRAAWELVEEGGRLAVSFSVGGGPWLSDRIYWTLAEATGREPVVVEHDLYLGSTFVVEKSRDPPELASAAIFRSGGPDRPRDRVRTTSDDWPFLYLRPDSIPWGYASLLLLVLGGTVVSVRRVFGRDTLSSGFDAPLFFMGAAFLLLETRGVTNLSLLFGSTWVVNLAVFTGILVTVLGANLLVARYRPRRAGPWFVPLLLSLLLLYLVPAARLVALPVLARGLLGGLLIGLPVGFAGVVVSVRLSRARNGAAALGSNLVGAVLGGCMEYLSMWIGLQSLLILAAGLYLAAWATIHLEEGSDDAAPLKSVEAAGARS